MRTLQMLGAAAQAEGLRIRREVAGTVRQVAWIVAAAMFGIAAVVTAHLAGIAYLTPEFGVAGAAAIVMAVDLGIAVVFALLSRRRPDPVAVEARLLRQTMLASVTQRDAMRDVLGLALRMGSGPLLGAVTGKAVSGWLRRR